MTIYIYIYVCVCVRACVYVYLLVPIWLGDLHFQNELVMNTSWYSYTGTVPVICL